MSSEMIRCLGQRICPIPCLLRRRSWTSSHNPIVPKDAAGSRKCDSSRGSGQRCLRFPLGRQDEKYDEFMADFMNANQRSAHMAKIRSKDTKPELWLRRRLHADGYRYRLHDRRLPGSPDLVFGGRKKLIFVHGCFWHCHDCPVGSRLPKTNTEFWAEKMHRNRERDEKQRLQLDALGWEILVVWECEVKTKSGLLKDVERFLDQ